MARRAPPLPATEAPPATEAATEAATMAATSEAPPAATETPASAAPDAPAVRRKRGAGRQPRAAAPSASDKPQRRSVFRGSAMIAAIEGVISMGAEIGVKSIAINVESGTFEIVQVTTYSTK